MADQLPHNFFLRVIKLCETLPESPAGQSISRQLIDSSGGTDSNYRAACRARSTKEFIAKIGVAAEEADESKGWLQALHNRPLHNPSVHNPQSSILNVRGSLP